MELHFIISGSPFTCSYAFNREKHIEEIHFLTLHAVTQKHYSGYV